MSQNRTRKTAYSKDEWTVEPVRISERETLVELLLRRIVELETHLAAQPPERSIR
jgi:hypothetical protein